MRKRVRVKSGKYHGKINTKRKSPIGVGTVYTLDFR